MSKSQTILRLPQNQDSPRVQEAKGNVSAALGYLDPALVGFAMRLAEERDAWANTRKRQ